MKWINQIKIKVFLFLFCWWMNGWNGFDCCFLHQKDKSFCIAEEWVIGFGSAIHPFHLFHSSINQLNPSSSFINQAKARMMEWKQWRNELLEWNSFAAEERLAAHNPQLSSFQQTFFILPFIQSTSLIERKKKRSLFHEERRRSELKRRKQHINSTSINQTSFLKKKWMMVDEWVVGPRYVHSFHCRICFIQINFINFLFANCFHYIHSLHSLSSLSAPFIHSINCLSFVFSLWRSPWRPAAAHNPPKSRKERQLISWIKLRSSPLHASFSNCSIAFTICSFCIRAGPPNVFNSLLFFIRPIRKSRSEKKRRNWLTGGLSSLIHS